MRAILAISGSPRPGGNTEFLLERLLAAAGSEGAKTKLFSVAGKTIAGCTACDACQRRSSGFCVVEDDMAPLYPLLEWADAVVFGSPVYMGGMTAQLKAIFDRCRPLWRRSGGLLGKPAAAVVVGEGRWGRQEFALQTIYWAAVNHGMFVPEPDADVCAVADGPGEVAADKVAVAAAEALGRKLARLRIVLD